MSNSAMPKPPKGYRLIATARQKKNAGKKLKTDLYWGWAIGGKKNEWLQVRDVHMGWGFLSGAVYARRISRKDDL
jgi:hypothetical protein